MSLYLQNVREATTEEWDMFWEACPYSTYYHSREWSEIWQVYSRGHMNPAPLLISFSDGKRVLLPITIQQECKGYVKISVLSPADTYGGWLSSDELSDEHTTILMDHMIATMPNLIWRSNPYCEYEFKNSGSVIPDHTRALDLDADFSSILKRWNKGNRAAVRQSERFGVTTRYSTDLTEWQAYFRVYQDAASRWGNRITSFYNWELFRDICNRNSKFVRLWIAELNKQIVAGALCLYSGYHVAYWHGASLKQYFRVRPSNLLLHNIIKDACENNYRWFDFNPSGGHRGVEEFKKSFGTRVLSAPTLRNIDLRSRLAISMADMVRYLKRHSRTRTPIMTEKA